MDPAHSLRRRSSLRGLPPSSAAARAAQRLRSVLDRDWVLDHTAADAADTELRSPIGPQERYHFPGAAELRLLPGAVQEALREAAQAMLAAMLAPRFVVRLRQSLRAVLTKALLAEGAAGPPTAVMLRAVCPSMAGWERLEALVPLFRPRALMLGEAVLFGGEPPESGLHVVTVGAVSYTTVDGEAPQSPRRATAASPILAGDNTTLTRLPQRRTVAVVTHHALVWALPLAAVVAHLRAQPPAVQQAVEAARQQQRLGSMEASYRARLHASSLGRHLDVPPPLLPPLAATLRPLLLPSGGVLVAEGSRAEEHTVFVIVAGTVRVTTADGDTLELEAPCAVGDFAAVRRLRQPLCCVAVTEVDAFRTDTTLLRSQLATLRSLPRRKSGAGPAVVLDDAGVRLVRHLHYARTVPLLAAVAASDASPLLRDVALALQPRSYGMGAVVAAMAEHCDRLLLVSQGRAVSSGHAVPVGEWVGYACLVPHRWTRRIVAATPLETLELPEATYRALLAKHGALRRVAALTRALLNPHVAGGAERAAADAAVAPLHTPATYPVVSEDDALAGVAIPAIARRPDATALAKLPPIRQRAALRAGPKGTVSQARIVLDGDRLHGPRLQRVPVAAAMTLGRRPMMKPRSGERLPPL